MREAGKHALSYQTKHALAEQLRPQYRDASRVQKTALLDAFVKLTGYTRKSAIRVLNHAPGKLGPLTRSRSLRYGPRVLEALVLAWKAAQYICARRLMPSLPTLVAFLERFGHLSLSEEDRQRLLAMSVSTAERFLRTQPKPHLHGRSATTPGSLSMSQVPVCLVAPWERDRPGFVEMDLVAHCGNTLDGCFLSTMTLTDLATGWTECIPLLTKSADAVVAALSLARWHFPFPLLGIDTDSGSEFLNEKVLAYCKQNQLTMTRGRPYKKNDQAHVEQKNKAVVRGTVGWKRLEGGQAYEYLGKVYQVLRLVVNCFQPSVKLQEIVSSGDQARRVYDVAQTPLERVLRSGVFSDARQQEVTVWFQHLDPLALSELLEALRQMLWNCSYQPLAVEADGAGWSEVPSPSSATLPGSSECLSATVPSPPSSPLDAPKAGFPGSLPLEQAMASYLQEQREGKRLPKTLEWHQTSLLDLQRYIWRHIALPQVYDLKQETLHAWLAELRTVPSAFTGCIRSVATIAAYARSVRAFCSWLVRRGLVIASPFPPGAVPQAPEQEPRVVEAKAFARLLEVCDCSATSGSRDPGMMVRNRAILWLLRETGLQVSDLCGLRLMDMDGEKGVVTVGEKGRDRRTFPLSPESQRVVKQYLEQARLTPSWTPRRREDRDVLLLTERRKALQPNSVTLLFVRLNRRAGFSRKSICPSMLRDTYAIGFLQAGGELAALQGQLGVADLASVRRYQRFCGEQQSVEARVQALLKPPEPVKGSKRALRRTRREKETGGVPLRVHNGEGEGG